MYTPSQMELVLDFVIALARQMILAGANLERVELAVEKICSSYGFYDVSIFLLSTHMSISARDEAGAYASRQVNIPPASIHLARLRSLNRLSYRVCQEKPEPASLNGLLTQAMVVKEYPDPVILLGQVIGMLCLCFLFNGAWQDAVSVAIITVLIHYLMMLLSHPGINRIITNFLGMFAATSMAIFSVYIGFAPHFSSIVITITMLILPGIPLVNAVRNLICDHEINGLLQILKVAFETLSLAFGTVVALNLFGGWIAW